MPNDSEREEGFVKWFNEQKGYGFIERPNGRDLFVHYKNLKGKLNQGDKVSYEIGEARKSACAINVKVLERAEIKEDS